MRFNAFNAGASLARPVERLHHTDHTLTPVAPNGLRKRSPYDDLRAFASLR